eukprot:9501136-Pyramimonas_sp.AAC.1
MPVATLATRCRSNSIDDGPRDVAAVQGRRCCLRSCASFPRRALDLVEHALGPSLLLTSPVDRPRRLPPAAVARRSSSVRLPFPTQTTLPERISALWWDTFWILCIAVSPNSQIAPPCAQPFRCW